MSFDLPQVQQSLRDFELDGWILYDFRGSNPLARTVLQSARGKMESRRWVYAIPAEGEPLKLVHRIEQTALDQVPGERTVYLSWQEFEAALAGFCEGRKTVAMEYSPMGGNPYISRVDAGTVELIRSFGPKVVSSGNLIQQFEAVWSDAQWQQHLRAAEHTDQAYSVAWKHIADGIRNGNSVTEKSVEQAIMDYFGKNRLTTYHPPIVARNEHSASPHYLTGSGQETRLQEGDFVLIDLWAKVDEPGSVYSDLTRVGYIGETVPEQYQEIFRIVAAARDRGIEVVREAMQTGRNLSGAEVDDAVRKVISVAGYAHAFSHRTGHNIGQEVHGNGAHIDNLETREDRLLLPGTCFSIEPGIYLQDFGIRLETDVYIDLDRQVHVTGGPLQEEVLPVLRDF